MADKSTSYDETTENIETRGYVFLQAACAANNIACQPVDGDIHRLTLTMPNGDSYYTAATYRSVAGDHSYHTSPSLFRDLKNHMNESDVPPAVAFVVIPKTVNQKVLTGENVEIMIAPIREQLEGDTDNPDAVVRRATDGDKYVIRYCMSKETDHALDDMLYRGGLSLRTDRA